MKQEIGRLRSLSHRLRLYGEIPSLYARRFSERETPTRCSSEQAIYAAQAIARQWERGGDLSIDATPASAPLPADSLAIVTRELVDNACKFTAPSTPVIVDMRSEPAYWKLTVADLGPGMCPEQIQSIAAYKQFWNGSERPAGLGLGLVLVQSLARLHSGEFLIESEPGTGVRVTIMIPSECQ
jgi:signal transduction histidine kinase